MNIAIFSWEAQYAITIGGVSAHVTGLSTALAAAGNEVHLFTRASAEYSGTALIAGVYYHYCPYRHEDDFFAEVNAFNQSLYFYFTQTEKEIGGFAIIHCNDWLTFIAGVKLKCENKARRFIATFHTTEWGRSECWPEHGVARQIADVEKSAVANANAVIMISYEIRRQVNILYHAPEWKSRVIYYGVHCLPQRQVELDAKTARQHFHLAENTPIALFVGSLNQRKGADILLSQLASIFSAAPNAKFIIAGNGELLQQYQQFAHENNHAEKIVFITEPTRILLAQVYCAADVVVIPYRYDPFGMVALSAFTAAKPIIVCGHGAASEFVYHEVNGFKADENNFAKYTAQLLNDRDQAKWLGQNARATADSAFNWQVIAEQTLAAYHIE